MFQLRSPANTVITLMDDEGGAQDGGNVLFDDEAENLVEDVNNTVPTGWLRPENSLTTFDGLNATGNWDLIVTDDQGGDTGAITGWSLRFNCFDQSSDLANAAIPTPPVPIPDLGSGASSVSVFDCDTVTDVDAEVVLQHSQVADVVIELEHGGITVVLWDSNTDTQRGAWVRFDDEGAVAIQEAVVSTDMNNPWPVGFGNFRPDNPLSTFDGAPGDGPWTLTVRDVVGADSGELQQFGVGVACMDTPPPPDAVIPLFGAGRVQTAIAVSNDSFPANQSAAVAVLATEGNFADALAGTPLAVAANGPLLLTPAASLVADTEAELTRVVAPGGTVYLLGGPVALSESVETAVGALGFTVERLQGPTRFETAGAIADEVESVNPLGGVVIADGTQFQAALVGGALAAQLDSALLLSNGALTHPATDAFVGAGLTERTIGGVAADAYPALDHVADEPEPAAMSVAAAAFLDAQLGAPPTVVGVANLVTFPDGLTGGAHIARQGGPLLLTAQETLSPAVATYLTANEPSVSVAFVYGGDAAVAPAVRASIQDAITA